MLNEKMVVLYATKMGCDFSSNDPMNEKSDLQNYRLRIKFTDKNGATIYGDISRGYRYQFNKKDGTPLKKYKIVTDCALSTDFEHEIIEADGCTATYIYNCLGNNAADYDYTENSALEFLNKITYIHFDRLIPVTASLFQDAETYQNTLDHSGFNENKALNGAGWREKDIYKNQRAFNVNETNKDHKIITFYSFDGRSCDYDMTAEKWIG